MPAKTIQQQPVALPQVAQVTYVVPSVGVNVDYSYSYTPVDETGAPVGEKRALSGTATGPTAQEIRNWITTHVLPPINAHEGTEPE
jgi:hypothetical protein